MPLRITLVTPRQRRRTGRHAACPGPNEKPLKPVKAFRWCVVWGFNVVIVTAADHVDAVALVLGHDRIGKPGGTHGGTYVPDMRVWRATELDEQFYKPLAQIIEDAAAKAAALALQQQEADSP